MSDLALSYSFMTKPDILQAGNKGVLTIIVSNAGAPLEISGIDFVLSMGTGARDIVDGVEPKAIDYPDGWTFPSPTGGKFAMAPAAPVKITRQGLVFSFALDVNTVVGTAVISVTEHLIVDQRRRVNRGSLLVPKFPKNFSLDEFYSAKPIVNQGDIITLVWTGQNLHLANYKIMYSEDGLQKTINIPANTYSYTLKGIRETSVFYLQATSTQASDTSVTRQSQEYLVSVNPAIIEFQATSPLASPGEMITLNWIVSKNMTSGQITCLQSGEVIPLDQTDLKSGKTAVKVPAIGISTQYLLDVFDSNTETPTASRETTVSITASIPHLGNGTGYFFTDAQASDVVTKLPSRPITDTVVPKLMKEIFARFKVYYPDFDFYLDWENDKANTESFVYIDGRKKVVIYGGLVRVTPLYYEAFCFIVAQCVGRLSGTKPVDANGLTYIGVADYEATASILSHVFFAITADNDLTNGVKDQIKTLFKDGISAENQKGTPGSPTNPGIICRNIALSAGIFGKPIPDCVT